MFPVNNNRRYQSLGYPDQLLYDTSENSAPSSSVMQNELAPLLIIGNEVFNVGRLISSLSGNENAVLQFVLHPDTQKTFLDRESDQNDCVSYITHYTSPSGTALQLLVICGLDNPKNAQSVTQYTEFPNIYSARVIKFEPDVVLLPGKISGVVLCDARFDIHHSGLEQSTTDSSVFNHALMANYGLSQPPEIFGSVSVQSALEDALQGTLPMISESFQPPSNQNTQWVSSEHSGMINRQQPNVNSGAMSAHQPNSGADERRNGYADAHLSAHFLPQLTDTRNHSARMQSSARPGLVRPLDPSSHLTFHDVNHNRMSKRDDQELYDTPSRSSARYQHPQNIHSEHSDDNFLDFLDQQDDSWMTMDMFSDTPGIVKPASEEADLITSGVVNTEPGKSDRLTSETPALHRINSERSEHVDMQNLPESMKKHHTLLISKFLYYLEKEKWNLPLLISQLKDNKCPQELENMINISIKNNWLTADTLTTINQLLGREAVSDTETELTEHLTQNPVHTELLKELSKKISASNCSIITQFFCYLEDSGMLWPELKKKLMATNTMELEDIISKGMKTGKLHRFTRSILNQTFNIHI